MYIFIDSYTMFYKGVKIIYYFQGVFSLRKGNKNEQHETMALNCGNCAHG